VPAWGAGLIARYPLPVRWTDLPAVERRVAKHSGVDRETTAAWNHGRDRVRVSTAQKVALHHADVSGY